MKQLSYGEANGLIILAGKELGYKVNFEEQAESLVRGDVIATVFLGSIDAEASRISNLVRFDSRIDEANEVVNKILSMKNTGAIA